MRIKELSEKYYGYVVEKRRYFHMNPEPSRMEYNTSRVVQEELTRLGIPFEVIPETAVIATITSDKPGDTVLLRADMDALEIEEKNDVEYKSQKPGLMHACGHDGHTAMLLGAAHMLMDMKDEIEGTVKLFFQPAEETASGAKDVLDKKDILEGVDGVFAIHLWQGVETGRISLEPGPRMAAADIVTIDIEGKAGHGSMPHDTVDSVLVSSAVVMNLQSLVSRNTSPNDALVVSIGSMNVGTRYNIIAGSGHMEGTCRSFDENTWARIPEMLERVVVNTCEAYGAKGTVSMIRATPPLINDARVSRIGAETVTELFGEDALVNYEKTTGGEDFAYLTKARPGILAFVGIRNEEKGITAAHHNECFNIDEDALRTGMELYTGFAIDFLKKWKDYKDMDN